MFAIYCKFSGQWLEDYKDEIDIWSEETSEPKNIKIFEHREDAVKMIEELVEHFKDLEGDYFGFEIREMQKNDQKHWKMAKMA